MNDKQAKVHSALSNFTFTPGYEFTPRMVELGIEQSEIHPLLVELREQGLAELCYGRGWRAIPGPGTVVEEPYKTLYYDWQIAVSERLTILGFPEWVSQQALAEGWNPDEPEN